MKASTAFNKLKKLLGKHAYYRTNMSAPDAELRVIYAREADELRAKVDEAKQARDTRYRELLKDKQYCELYDAHKQLQKKLENLDAKKRSYPIEVGTCSEMGGMNFLHEKARGDTWREIFAKLEAKKD